METSAPTEMATAKARNAAVDLKNFAVIYESPRKIILREKQMLRVHCLLPPPPASVRCEPPNPGRRKKLKTCRRFYSGATAFGIQSPLLVAPPCVLIAAPHRQRAPVDTRRRQGRAALLHRTFFRGKCATRKHWRGPAARRLPPGYSWTQQSPWKTILARDLDFRKALRQPPARTSRANHPDEPPGRVQMTLRPLGRCGRKSGAALQRDPAPPDRQKLRAQGQQQHCAPPVPLRQPAALPQISLRATGAIPRLR